MHQKFLDFSLKTVPEILPSVMVNLSTALFIVKLIQELNDPSKFRFLYSLVRDWGSKLIFEESHFLRILSAYYSIIEDQHLAANFKTLKPHVWSLLNDKFGNYILERAVEKNV